MRNGNTGALVLGTVAATNGTYGTYAWVVGVGPGVEPHQQRRRRGLTGSLIELKG